MHLTNEAGEPRSDTLNMRPKTCDSHCVSDPRPRNSKFQTGLQIPGHLSCLGFDTQNPVKDSARRFQKDLSSDVKIEDLNSKGQEKFA